MAMTINTNSIALTAQRNINAANMRTTSSLAKLSSGSRVPSAKDDVAALAVGTKLRAEVQSLQQAQQNVGQGVSLLQIADGALNTISDMLARMKVLAVQSTSGQLGDAERTLINREYSALSTEIDRIAADTAFNGTTLLAGSVSTSADINNMNNDGGINLIGEGFESIDIADTFGDGAIKIEYDNTSNIMSVTNLATNASQSIDITATAVAVGQTQQIAFNSLGVTVELNSSFDKGVAINATNTSTNADVEAGSISFEGIVVGDPAFDWGTVDEATLLFDTATALTSNASITLGGVSFNQKAAVDLTTLGTKTLEMQDADGNEFSIEFNVTTALTNAEPLSFEILEFGQTVGANSIAGTSSDFTFKVGTGTDAEDDIQVSVGAGNFIALAGSAVGNVSTATAAAAELTKLLDAIDGVTSLRATVGAAQSSLEFAGASIAVTTENTLSAQSSMLDVDVSQEMTEFTSSQVLLQAGISMLAQANQQPQLLLSLLQ